MKVGEFNLIRFHPEWRGGERYWIHNSLGDLQGEIRHVKGKWYAENVFYQVPIGYVQPLRAIRALIDRSG